MAPASSSAMRDESAADGLGYGSLTGIGGPKKFKKKPVLVLDPEELEAAHALFQEASAELCGQEVERAPRPATVLGLAPMLDDDPEEMGASDEDGAEDDDTPVDTEAVLSLTRRKSNAMPIDEYFGDDLDDDDIYGASAPDLNPASDGSPSPDGEIDDGLDLSKRIFPSLNLAQSDDPPADDLSPSDDASEGAENAASFAKDDATDQLDPAHELTPAMEPQDTVDDEVSSTDSDPEEKPISHIPLDAKLSDYRDLAPNDDQPGPDGEPEEPGNEVPPEAHANPSDTSMHDHPRPARFDELNPDRPADDEDVFDLDAWLAEDQPEPTIVERPYTYEPKGEGSRVPASLPEATEEDPDSIGPDAPVEDAPEKHDLPTGVVSDDAGSAGSPDGTRYTAIEDDEEVDGYAFMRNEKRSRPMPVRAHQAGQQNSLRAKLAKDDDTDSAQHMREIEEPDLPRSVIARMWNWLKGLFN